MKKLSVCLLTTFIFGALQVFAAADETKKDGVAAPAADAAASKQAIQSAQGQASSEGLDKEASELKASADKILQYANSASANIKVPKELAAQFAQQAQYYNLYHGVCTSSQATASTICREKTSPQLQNTLNSINTVASMITGVAVKDSCSTFAKIAKIGQMGLTAYTAACSAARGACEASCSNVKSNLDRMKAIDVTNLATCTVANPAAITAGDECMAYTMNVNALIPQIKTTIEADSSDANPKSVALKNTACTYEYTNMLVSAGAGIASMIAGFNSGQDCDDKSNGTGDVAATTPDTTEKCAKPENAQLPECLCIANPRLPGCANALQKAGDSSTSNLQAMSSPNAGSGTDKTGSGLDLSSDGSRDPASAANKSADSAGGIGAPTGGGGAGLSGGGGGFGGGAAGASGTADKKGLSANILGGGSGGGGGGSWGSGGSSSDNAKLRPYLPGGEKDPNKMAGQQNWTKEVTGQGGKSNWEKVRDRYRDNNSSLLNSN